MFLTNISNTEYDLNKFNLSWDVVQQFLDRHKLNGLEFILHGDEYLDDKAKELAKGLHLKYFPTWLEFYNGEKHKLEIMFENEAEIINCYGGLEPESLVEFYKKEYLAAKNLGVEYMVYHVGHVTTEHAFTFDFDYNDEHVLDATVDIVNKAFHEDSEIFLLFENLWWPGMNLLDKQKTLNFLDKVKYKNKGIMLDLSHLLITNPEIENIQDGTKYILDKIKELGDVASYIKGIHVNMALPGKYMYEDHSEKYEEIKSSDSSFDKYIKTISHIKKMDWHVPYEDYGIRKIIDIIKPEYVVYEFLTNDINELERFVKIQNKYVGR